MIRTCSWSRKWKRYWCKYWIGEKINKMNMVWGGATRSWNLDVLLDQQNEHDLVVVSNSSNLFYLNIKLKRKKKKREADWILNMSNISYLNIKFKHKEGKGEAGW